MKSIQGTCWYLGCVTVGIFLTIIGRTDIFSCYIDDVLLGNINIYSSGARIGGFGGVAFKTLFGDICHLA